MKIKVIIVFAILGCCLGGIAINVKKHVRTPKKENLGNIDVVPIWNPN